MLIVIPTWNGLHLLADCLKALHFQTSNGFQVCVVDNGSTDGTVDWLRNEHPTVKIIKLLYNTGFSRAVNEGIKSSDDDLVVLLNNDTVVRSDWVENLFRASQEQPDVSIFASKVIIQNSGNRLDTAGDGFTVAGFGFKHGWNERDSQEYSVARDVFSASGCAMMIRRSVFNAIGFFDEDFFAFGEDLDFCFRARLAGYRIRYVPNAVIEHRVRATAQKQHTHFLYYRNLIWLVVKNYPTRLLFFHLPHILLNNALMCCRSLIRREFRVYLRGIACAVMGLPTMMKKRRVIQQHMRISVRELDKMLTHQWLGVHWRLRRANRELD